MGCDEVNPSDQRLNPTDHPISLDRAQMDDSLELSDTTLQSQGSSDLPPFDSLSPPNFRWGELEGVAFTDVMNRAYDEIVKWRRNLFDVPRGKAGMLFVCEMQRLIDAYNHATTMEGIALKAAMVLPALVLQRPHVRITQQDWLTE